MQNLALFVIVGGIIGARIYYVLFSDLSYFLAEPLSLLAFWQGGLAIHGAIIGGTLVGIWFTWRGEIPLLLPSS